MIILGLILISISFFTSSWPATWGILLIYGIPLFILGLVIFFNKKEDKIEPIKSQGGKKRK